MNEPGGNTMAQAWYVLRSKPHKEGALNRYAVQQGHHVFYPRIPVNPVNPRARKERPYFPGYLFVQTDLETQGRSAFHWMPFSQGLVRVGDEPARVPLSVVVGLQRRIAEIWQEGGLEMVGLERGDRVLITAGAFEGYQGIFDHRLEGRQRVRVLLRMLSDRYVPAEVDLGTIEKDDRR